jgi:rare lipoprotein A
LLFLLACAAIPQKSAPKGKTTVGKASYYADTLHGRPTASGERYDRNGYTAAHRSLPFGTRVLVTNRHNGRKVKVRINDRGPFVAGRIIDLSYAAAAKLNMLKAGVVPVEVTIVSTP